MANTQAKTFIEYALSGFFLQNRRLNDPKLWVITKAGLQKVFGTSRIGYAQREQMRETCIAAGIGMAELSDRFIFFDPDELKGMVFDMTKKADVLTKLTD